MLVHHDCQILKQSVQRTFLVSKSNNLGLGNAEHSSSGARNRNHSFVETL